MKTCARLCGSNEIRTSTLSLEAKGSSLPVPLLLDKGFVEGKDDRHGQQDTRSRSNRPHEIGNHREGANAHATKGRRRGNVAVQDVNQGRIAVSLHDHLVVAELLGHIARRRARNFNPRLGKQGARRQNEGQVKDGVEGIVDDLRKGLRR